MSFVIALLLCLGDNCDLVRAEPDVYYQTYEECSAAIAKKPDAIERAGEALRADGRASEIICLRPNLSVDALAEVRKAHVDTEIRDEPVGTARAIGHLSRGEEIHVTGKVLGQDWVRVATADGKTGYVFAERLVRPSQVDLQPSTGPDRQASKGDLPPASKPSSQRLDATFIAPRAVAVRAEPQANAKLIGSLQPHAAVHATEKLAGTWLRINWSGGEGFVTAASMREVDASETALWDRVKGTRNVDEVLAFLAAHPNGAYSEQAVALLETLRRPASETVSREANSGAGSPPSGAQPVAAPPAAAAPAPAPADPLEGRWSADYRVGVCSWHGDLSVKEKHVTGVITMNMYSFNVDTTWDEGRKIHQYLAGGVKVNPRSLDGEFPHLVVTTSDGQCGGAYLDLVRTPSNNYVKLR
jgi:hypothetical protein